MSALVALYALPLPWRQLHSAKPPSTLLPQRHSDKAKRGKRKRKADDESSSAKATADSQPASLPPLTRLVPSLLPFLHGQAPENWREFVISEYNYSVMPAAGQLGVSDADARLFMVFDGRFKLIHFQGGFRPMLFDLESDPDEFLDLGEDPAQAGTIARLYDHLAAWGRRQSQRVTRSAADLAATRGKSRRRGIILGAYDQNDVERDLIARYIGPAGADYTGEG